MGSLTDTHCHLNLNTFQEDLAAVIQRAEDNGVERILIPGIDLETSRKAVEIADRFPCAYAAVGVHPSDANSWNATTRAELTQLASHPKVVAIGEMGLDYYRDHAPRDVQRSIFREQLELAAEVGKPVSIHNRDAGSDVWNALVEWQMNLEGSHDGLAGRPGVLHSFDGNLDEANAMVAAGFYLGISGPVTFTNARQRQKLVAELPLSCLLVETDAPYLTPHPHRGRRNEPAYTKFIVEKIAELHQVEYDLIAKETAANAARLFAWGAEI